MRSSNNSRQARRRAVGPPRIVGASSVRFLAAATIATAVFSSLFAATPKESASPVTGGGEKARESAELKDREQRITAQYKRFEEVLMRMAELTAADDPQRAILLRQAATRSKKRLISIQFERIGELLASDQLSVAVTNQDELLQDLKNLLDLLLSEDRSKRLESEQQRIRNYLKQLNKLIVEQQGIQSQTRRLQEAQPQLTRRQQQLSENTDKLGSQIKSDADQARKDSTLPDDQDPESKKARSDRRAEDKPDEAGKQADRTKNGAGQEETPETRKGASDLNKESLPQQGQSPGQEEAKPAEQPESSPEAGETGEPGQEEQPTDVASQRLKKAQQRMSEAKARLEQAQRDAALDRQREALEELEQAKADLEKILRQLREEELARVLAQLETRFRKMLEQQTQIYEATERLVALTEAELDRGAEIESGRLSRKESQIAIEADKALALLREDATAVAMPEAVREIRDDMQQVATRLGEFKTDQITVGIEQDILAGLEDILAAIKKAQQDLEQKQNSGQSSPPGEPQEPPLVDALAELKVIRALQMRVNRRTAHYAQLVDGEQADKPELLEALEDLAARQERIFRTTRDIAIGRNQ